MITPEPKNDEVDEILDTHRSETWSTGWNNDATAKAKAAINQLIARKEKEAKIAILEHVRGFGERGGRAIYSTTIGDAVLSEIAKLKSKQGDK